MAERFTTNCNVIRDGNAHLVTCGTEAHAERIARMLNAGERMADAMNPTVNVKECADILRYTCGHVGLADTLDRTTNAVDAALAAWEEAAQ